MFASPSFSQTGADDDFLIFLPAILANKPSNNTASLCSGFAVNDKQDRPMQSMAKPLPGARYVDNVFGSNITRITNSSQIASGIIKTLYSTIQAWNADESLMILWHRGDGHYLYDGKSYALLQRLPLVPTDIEELFWSTSDPDLLYYPNNAVGSTVMTEQGSYLLKGKELMSYDVSSQKFAVIKDLNSVCSGPDGVTGGNDVQMMAYDDDVFGLRCGSKGFSYQRSNDSVTVLPSSANFAAPSVFPSGDRFYHEGNVLNQQLTTQTTLDLGSANEHASLGRLSNGDDGYFASAFDPNNNNSCGDGVGSVVVHDATNASCRVLVGQSSGYPYTLSGTHLSALAYQRPGWVAVSSVGYGDEGDTLLEQELYLVNANPSNPEVCRIAHHRSSARHGSIGYFAEPHPVISPSGTRVLFNSDWNNSGSVDVYVVELAGY